MADDSHNLEDLSNLDGLLTFNAHALPDATGEEFTLRFPLHDRAHGDPITIWRDKTRDIPTLCALHAALPGHSVVEVPPITFGDLARYRVDPLTTSLLEPNLFERHVALHKGELSGLKFIETTETFAQIMRHSDNAQSDLVQKTVEPSVDATAAGFDIARRVDELLTQDTSFPHEGPEQLVTEADYEGPTLAEFQAPDAAPHQR